jgi:hypothetical protein
MTTYTIVAWLYIAVVLVVLFLLNALALPDYFLDFAVVSHTVSLLKFAKTEIIPSTFTKDDCRQLKELLTKLDQSITTKEV